MPKIQNPYFLPPEWAKQTALLLCWPHHSGDWGKQIEGIERSYLAITKSVSQHEAMILIAFDDTHQQHIQKLLLQQNIDTNSIKIIIIPCNDIWLRDTAPITVFSNEKTIWLDFLFNAWGEKYAYDLDQALGGKLYDHQLLTNIEYQKNEIILEGGNIDVNGDGSLITHAHCLTLRNPDLQQSDWHALFLQYFAVDHVHFLENGGLIGDDTDNHIDTLVRFCRRNTLCYSQCDNKNDQHYESLQAMENEIKHWRNREGNPYELIPLPIPKAIYNENGERLPANYCNFALINNAVLLPFYQDPADEVALTRLRAVFPERQIITFDSLPLIQQRGSIHCASMGLYQR